MEGRIRLVSVSGQPGLEIDLTGCNYAQVEAFRAAWRAVLNGGHAVLNVNGERVRLGDKREGQDGIFKGALKSHREAFAGGRFQNRRGT
ncbi:MAG: hypothetical protein KGR26_10855 [Cyanobacteria bacterium REEB65]|nr:hypothetical protein [Cyanobacteria bacterium REEB65]